MMKTNAGFLRHSIAAIATSLLAGIPLAAADSSQEASYCDIKSPGAVLFSRPEKDNEPAYIDDVNWFARPVPNAAGDYIVGYASHNQNYLYNLSSGKQVAIPYVSDAVATPDGRYITIPSHYTPNHAVSFFDASLLLDHLARSEDARHIKPFFEHLHSDVYDVIYQSTGILSSEDKGEVNTTRYRMMFSGSLPPTPPGFLIADYEITNDGQSIKANPSPVLQLCPQIVGEMSTAFISKDGRYIVAHDNSLAEQDATLKIFEITDVDYQAHTTQCEMVVDFGFRAGKADFSFDNSQLTFHLSSNDYVTRFIDSGISGTHLTDVVVAKLKTDKNNRIKGLDSLSRLTTSTEFGIGNYFPAFFPDGKLFYIASQQAKEHPLLPVAQPQDRRFKLMVVDPEQAIYRPNIFLDDKQRDRANIIARLWRSECSDLSDSFNYPMPEAKTPWQFMSLSQQQCSALVKHAWRGNQFEKRNLLRTCRLK